MALRIEPLPSGKTDGVLVRGVTDALLDDENVRTDLRDLWIDRGLIVFKGDVDAGLHVKLSKVFGSLEEHPVREIWVEDFPQLIELTARPGNGAVYEWNGEQRGSWIPWHTDLIYTPRLNHGGILRGVTIPTAGGDTGFMDKIKLYDALDEATKARIDSLSVVYKAHFDMTRHQYAVDGPVSMIKSTPKLDAMIESEDRVFPPVVHPLVYTQPETGRKLLNLSPLFADHIVGLEPDESHAVLSRLAAHVRREEFAYFHKWGPEDMVLWDNWRMLHSARGIDPQVERVMRRTTIAGDYAQGRLQ